jgi:HD-GYP domain-containing protein (c-di-GMP phosphodiesterase class II)
MIQEAPSTTDADRGSLVVKLHAAEAQALRATQDLRVLYAAEKQRRQELEAVYLQTLQVLAHAVEVRDDYTGGHVERVRRYSVAIAHALRLDQTTCRQVAMGAVLHDLGKIGVPDAVLTKVGQLDEREWTQMRTHPEKGAYLLRDVSFLAGALAGVEAHHERWDGQGYPHRLRRQEVPLLGRIVAVADAFDAMTSNRPYRRGMPWEVATARIQESTGSQFDPDVARAFLSVIPVIRPPGAAV